MKVYVDTKRSLRVTSSKYAHQERAAGLQLILAAFTVERASVNLSLRPSDHSAELRAASCQDGSSGRMTAQAIALIGDHAFMRRYRDAALILS
jgi:hypothetical protein